MRKPYLVGLLVLTVVLAACDTVPPTPSPQELANAGKTNAEAALILQQVQSEKTKAESEAKLAQANADLLAGQARNEKLLADQKAAGEKALNDASVDGQKRRDITAANTEAATAYSNAYKARVAVIMQVLQNNLDSQKGEALSYSLRNFVANLKPWLLAILMALATQFVISLGQWWFARIHAGEPRWRGPTLLDRVGAWCFNHPYFRSFEFRSMPPLIWRIFFKPDPPPGMWIEEAVHSKETETAWARLVAGSELIKTALLSARNVPNAARAISSLGENVTALITNGVSSGEACEHGNTGWCPIRSCPNHKK